MKTPFWGFCLFKQMTTGVIPLNRNLPIRTASSVRSLMDRYGTV